MAINVGDKVPNATLIHQKGDDVHHHELAELMAGRRVVIFGLPGAYTGICSSAHLPSFIRTADDFRAKGIDDVICISVNDVRVMNHWGESTGANDAGILMLADWDSEFAKATGLEFTNPHTGLKDRLSRFALLAEDGVAKIVQYEEDHSVCNLTAGETLLELV